MANNIRYYFVKNNSSIGESYISPKVFEDIAESIISKSKSARVSNNKTRQNNRKPIRCEIKKDNIVYLQLDIALKKGNDIKKTCDYLIDEIKNSVLLMSETKPNVDLNVVEIDL